MNPVKIISFLIVALFTSSLCRYVTIHTGEEFGFTIHPAKQEFSIMGDVTKGDKFAVTVGTKTPTNTATFTETAQPSATFTQTSTLTEQLTEASPTATVTLTRTPAFKKYYKPTSSCPQINLGTPCP